MSTKPESFFTRIKLINDSGKELTWIYSKETLLKLGLKQDEYEKSHFLEIGNIINLDGFKYQIINIVFKVEVEFHQMGVYGFNSSPDQPVDFNSTVNVFLKEVD